MAFTSPLSRAVPPRLRLPARAPTSAGACALQHAALAAGARGAPAAAAWWPCHSGARARGAVSVSSSAAPPPVRALALGRAGLGAALRRGYARQAGTSARASSTEAYPMEAGGGEQEADGDAAGEGVKGKRVKKRVAMFCGYVGSKYRGLQINRTAVGESTSRAQPPPRPPFPFPGGVGD